MKRKHWVITALAAIVCAAFIGVGCDKCSDDSSGGSITVSPSQATVEVGETVTLTAAGGENYVWTTENEAIATVSDGVVSGVSAGMTNITVTDGESSAVCAVTVVASSKVPALVMDVSEKTIHLSDEYTLSPALFIGGEKIDDVVFSFESSAPETVEVNAEGVVKGLSYGQAAITVSYVYGEYFDSVEVTVNVIRDAVLEISRVSAELVVAAWEGSAGVSEITVDVTEFQIEGERQEEALLKWRTSDDAVAAVEDGKITAVSYGTAVVSAYYAFPEGGEVSADVAVTVSRERVEITESAFGEIGFDYDEDNTGTVVLEMPLSSMKITAGDILSVQDAKGNVISEDGSLTVSDEWFGIGGATELTVYTNEFVFDVPITFINTKPQTNYALHNYVDVTLAKKDLTGTESDRTGTFEFVSGNPSNGYYKALAVNGGKTGMWLCLDIYFTRFEGERLSMGVLNASWGETAAEFRVFDDEGVQLTDLSADNIMNRWLTVKLRMDLVTSVSAEKGNILYFYFSAGTVSTAYIGEYRFLYEEKAFANVQNLASAEYYVMSDEGIYVLHSTQDLGSVTVGESVTAVAKEIEGFIYEASISTPVLTADYGTTVLKFYYDKAGTVHWNMPGTGRFTAASNAGVDYTFAEAEMSGADARDGVYLFDIESGNTGSCYNMRFNAYEPNGASVAGKWLIVNMYFTEYGGSNLAAAGLFGDSNYGSWGDYAAWQDFTVENLKVFEEESKEELLDLSAANIVDKWLTVAIKADKYTAENYLSFSLFRGITCTCYVEKYAWVSEEMLVTVFPSAAVARHWQQQEDGSYEIFESETLTVSAAGEQVNATPKEYAGYRFNADLSVVSGITGVGTLFLDLYYDLDGIIWQPAEKLEGKSFSGKVTFGYEAADVGGEDSREGTYLFTLEEGQNTYCAYELCMRAPEPSGNGIDGKWLLVNIYIAEHGGTSLVAKGMDSASGADYDFDRVVVFDENGTQITDLTMSALTGRWITVAMRISGTSGQSAYFTLFESPWPSVGCKIYFESYAFITDSVFAEQYPV